MVKTTTIDWHGGELSSFAMLHQTGSFPNFTDLSRALHYIRTLSGCAVICSGGAAICLNGNDDVINGTMRVLWDVSKSVSQGHHSFFRSFAPMI